MYDLGVNISIIGGEVIIASLLGLLIITPPSVV